MKEQYVILTGSKNNAGDYLIKYRAKRLFNHVRPDRKIIDYNAWEPIDKEKLAVINESRALILMGGPSLQAHMRPGIYNLPDDLDSIKPPIVTMGIGWKSVKGEWKDTHNYPLRPEAEELLERVENSGFCSSVRDYHTLNTLLVRNKKSFVMTGCPAYYDLDYLGKPADYDRKINKVAFSLGVSFIKSASMEILMKDTILKLRDRFKEQVFEVVFHHSLDKDQLLSSSSGSPEHARKHIEFSKWLESQGIEFCDISGSAENLVNYYSQVDLHVGYRVHAHIFMNSISRFSVLISEDGRAKGTEKVIGGLVYSGYSRFKDDFLTKVAKRIWPNQDQYVSNRHSIDDVLKNIDYEIKAGFSRLKASRRVIDSNYEVMQSFLQQLP